MAFNSMERRMHHRLKAREHKSFVLIPDDTKLGEIIDISLGGIAFHYLASEQWSNEVIQPSTLFGDDDLWLNNIPLKTISDSRITHPFSLGYPEARRRGVQFYELSPTQEEFIREFIYLNTVMESPVT